MTPAAADRRRRLHRLAGPGGVIAGLAIDHRDSLGIELSRRGLGDLAGDEIRALKLRLVRALAPAATAVMLDEEFGGPALDAGAVPPSIGLIMPLEAQGYEALGDGRTTTLLDGFSPPDALRRGADACKVLLPYRADDEPSATAQDALVIRTVAACHDSGLPLVVEPVAYRWSNETPLAFSDAYPRLVLDAVRRLAPLGADLLKLPFPVLDLASDGPSVAADACRELARACGGTPWVLLGAGADGETFIEQIGIAGAAGASGFLAGRGIWGVALDPDPDRAERLAATRASRLSPAGPAVAGLMLVGALLLLPISVVLTPLPVDPPVKPESFAWAALAGTTTVAGLLLVYRALRIGTVGIVSTIASTEGAIAAVISVIAGQTLAPGSGPVLAVIAIGVMLAATSGGQELEEGVPVGRSRSIRAASLAAVAACLFGAALFAIGQSSAAIPAAWVILTGRLVGVVLVALPLIVSGRFRVPSAARPFVVLTGLTEVLGYSAYAVGAREDIALTAVLASMFAPTAAVAAFILFRERLAPRQIVGIVLVVVGIAVLAFLTA